MKILEDFECFFNHFRMPMFNLKDFMKKNSSKEDTMTESELQKVYNYKTYPRDSRITNNK